MKVESLEVQLNRALAEIKHLREEITEYKLAYAKLERFYTLKACKLPQDCMRRINRAFSKSLDNSGLQQAINVEFAWLAKQQGDSLNG
jgi:hypothetical protein